MMKQKLKLTSTSARKQIHSDWKYIYTFFHSKEIIHGNERYEIGISLEAQVGIASLTNK